MAAIQPQVATQGFNLIITDRAAEEVRKFMEAEQVPVESAGLRVSVLPGGC
jgi:Fe-S cluster assembly iron-binding protein IscA